jgi:hypothetical protein
MEPVGRAIAYLVAPAALSVCAAAPATARADDSDKAMAQALFEDGTKLLGEGQLDQACAKLASSQRLDPQIGTLLYLATCHEQKGQTATAWAEFNEGLSELQRAPNARREAYTKQHLADVGSKLSRLVLTAPSATAGLQVKVDGKSLDAGTLGTPLPVDPGRHEIEAVAPRCKPWSEGVDVGAGPVDVSVVVPSLQPLPAESATPPPEAPKPAPDGSSHVAAYVVGSVGIAGLITGAVAGVVAISDKNKADSQDCIGTRCNPEGLSLYDTARTWGWVSNVGFAVGIAGVGLATYLLLFRGDAQSSVTGVRVTPTIGGLTMSGSW